MKDLFHGTAYAINDIQETFTVRKFALLFIVTILLTLCACGKNWEYLDIKEGGQTFEEIAVQLNELGINGFDQEMINAMQESWDQTPSETRLSINKTAWLLEAVGMGNYDYETWTYTPSSGDVYAFDMEVFNIEAMYRDFLQGVTAIGDGELEFTEIEEDLDNVNWEDGTGIRSITFQWRGNTYSLEADVDYDWFDCNLANQLNQIIMEQQGEKHLYFGGDGYQNIYVFYRDAEWASAFTKATGMRLAETIK